MSSIVTAAYLESEIRSGMSTCSNSANIGTRLRKLQDDLSSGEWEARYGNILRCDSYDYGYRIVSSGLRVARLGGSAASGRRQSPGAHRARTDGGGK